MANAPLSYVNSRGRNFKWYPDDQLKCVFWGRISGFDHTAVRAMVTKEPKLVRMKWYTSTPLSWLFNQDRAFFAMTDRPCPRFSRQTANRLPKMLRLLLELGADLPYNFAMIFHLYPFRDTEISSRCFRMLLCCNQRHQFVKDLWKLEFPEKISTRWDAARFGVRRSDVLRFQSQQKRMMLRRHLLKKARKLPLEMITLICTFV